MKAMAHLEQTRKSEIVKIVERMKLDTGLSYPDNALLEIAKVLGVEVVSAELPPFEDKKVKGYIKWFSGEETRDNPFIARIYLNSDQAETTKTFTLAHEIGHLLLHKDTNNFRIDLQDYSEESDPKNEETEANYFAGALLMPRNKLITAIKNSKNLQEVANLFGVSIPAVEARMKWLDVILV